MRLELVEARGRQGKKNTAIMRVDSRCLALRYACALTRNTRISDRLAQYDWHTKTHDWSLMVSQVLGSSRRATGVASLRIAATR